MKSRRNIYLLVIFVIALIVKVECAYATDAFVNSQGGWAHDKVTATTGNTVQLSGASPITVIKGTGLLALTVALPTNPFDGMRRAFSVPAGVTILTVTAAAPATVTTPTTSLTAGGGVTYMYDTADLAWYRLSN